MALYIESPQPIKIMPKYHHLSLGERYSIACQLQQAKTASEIAEHLGRPVSTVTREIDRNSFEDLYDPEAAQAICDGRRERASTKIRGKVLHFILRRLKFDDSPEQICLRLWRKKRIRLTATAIYRYIWADHEKGGRLWRFLRYCGRGRRLRRYGRTQKWAQHRARKDRRSIHDRSLKINARRDYGHWEMDLIEGKNHRGYLLVLVERKSRYVRAGRLKAKNSVEVARIARRVLRGLRVKSITTDNGFEFSNAELLERELGCPIFFTDPYSSWQKGQVENTNGLLRQYFPKGCPLEGVSAKRVRKALNRLNHRVRKCLGGWEPAEFLPHLWEPTSVVGV